MVLVYEVRQGYQCTVITPESGQFQSRRIVREREQDGRETLLPKLNQSKTPGSPDCMLTLSAAAQIEVCCNSGEVDTDAIKGETGELGCPCLAGCDRKRTRQRAGRDEFASGERRVDLVSGKNIDEMTQCRHGST